MEGFGSISADLVQPATLRRPPRRLLPSLTAAGWNELNTWSRKTEAVNFPRGLRLDKRQIRIALQASADGISLSAEDLCRHGLISGVTGSGKTSAAKMLSESLSVLGVPVFAVDSKGDFAGISQLATESGSAPRNVPGADRSLSSPLPVILWDPRGELGLRFDLSGGSNDRAVRTLAELRRVSADGEGHIGALSAIELLKTPSAYADLMYRLIAAFAEHLPEPKTSAQPQIVLFIEEAHLLFAGLCRRDRSRLVRALNRLSLARAAVIFVTSDPGDVPETIDRILGFRIQHSLWTLSTETTRRLAQRFGSQTDVDDIRAREAVRSLGIGEVLISHPDTWGQPTRPMLIRQPLTRAGTITPAERRTIVARTSTNGAWVGQAMATGSNGLPPRRTTSRPHRQPRARRGARGNFRR
jgi:hypothetical protein